MLRGRPRHAALAAAIVAGTVLVSAAPAAALNCAAFKAQVQNAHNGDVITLDAGLTCNDSYVLPSDRSAPFAFTIQGGGGGATLDGTGQAAPILTGEPAAGKQLVVTVRNLVFRHGSTSSGGGGAIHLAGADLSATLAQDRFFSNSEPTGDGGAVSIESTASTRTIEVSDSTFGDGTAAGANTGRYGGALRVNSMGSGPSVSIQRNRFAGNTASLNAGALAVGVNSSGTSVTLADNVFTSNTAHGFGGGAASVGTNSIVMRRNRFVQNTLASTSNIATGGAIAVDGDTTATLDQSDNRFVGNKITRASQPDFTAHGGGEWIEGMSVKSRRDRWTKNSIPAPAGSGEAEGGGLGIEGCAAPAPVLTASLLDDSAAGNSAGAGGTGAGVYLGGCSPGPLAATILDSTIAGNTTSGAGSTSGLAGGADDKLTLRNSIVTANPGGRNLAGFGASRTITNTDVCSPGVLPGANNICAAPRLRAPRHGNVHQTVLSPTINAGRNQAVPAGLAVDYEGDPRIRLGRVDMGADEYLDPFAGVVIPTQTATVKGGVAKVKVRCPANVRGPCVGTLRMAHAKKPIGSSSFSIARGVTAQVPFALNQNGRDALAASGGTLQLVAHARTHDGFGTQSGAAGQVTLKQG